MTDNDCFCNNIEYIKLCELSEILLALFIIFSFYSVRPLLLEHGIWEKVSIDGDEYYSRSFTEIL